MKNITSFNPSFHLHIFYHYSLTQSSYNGDPNPYKALLVRQSCTLSFTPKEPKREEAQVSEPPQTLGEEANPIQKGQG